MSRTGGPRLPGSRATTAAGVAVVAGSLWLASPSPAAQALAAAAVLAGLVASAAPDSPAPVLALGLLAAQAAVATAAWGGLARTGAAVAVGALLWTLHSGWALAAATPRGARVEPAALGRWRRRLVGVLVPAAGLAAGMSLLGVLAPAWLRPLGLPAGLAVALLARWGAGMPRRHRGVGRGD